MSCFELIEQMRPNRQRHGKGVYIDGNYQYNGEWKYDKMHGQGVFLGYKDITHYFFL